MYSQNEAIALNPSRIEEHGTSIRDYVDLLIEGKKTILLVLSSVLLITVVYLILAPRTYKADALLRIDRNKALLAATLRNEANQASTETESPRAQREVEILRSRSVLGKVVDNLNLTVEYSPLYFPIIGETLARRHDAHDGTEALVVHHLHRVIHVDEHSRRDVGAAGGVELELAHIDQLLCALARGVGDRRAHRVACSCAHHRAQCRCRVERVAENVFPRQRHRLLDELRINRTLHVNALDAATALPGIEERAVDQRFHGVIEPRVGTHIRRVVATQLQADRDEAPGSRALHGSAADDRTREAHTVDL